MPALTGLTLETLWVTPLALLMLVWVAQGSGLEIAVNGPLLIVLLASAGIVTSVPLLLFAAATRRLPLSSVGLLQYLNPILQALVGIVILAEPMPVERWWGLGLIMVALVIFVSDSLTARRFTGQ
jgi:chloramphenicol-sensitive protein RarD